ncbi:hypothetical protein M440DRAFT_318062 [Trichoderma longibrachiatum ATCC 18648]|uniref:Uncharacterized protein n=1 Tax=Trichoderma longibrachiatum ATCC 18648 TaxID=983965 RepID=A0A2T4C424_TRILO|nr:hypothetical protein M440DRAFT_318062 [Trichoderma longibrachiatum ATCC 18648]
MSANSLGGSIVIAWGVLFANSFLVLFLFISSYTSLGRCLFLLFLFLQLTGAHLWMGVYSEHIYQAFTEQVLLKWFGNTFIVRVCFFYLRMEQRVDGYGRSGREGEPKSKLKTNAGQLYRGIGN